MTGEELDLGELMSSNCNGFKATFCKPIPPVISDPQQVENMKNAGAAMSGSVSTIAGGNAAVTMVLGGSLQ